MNIEVHHDYSASLKQYAYYIQMANYNDIDHYHANIEHLPTEQPFNIIDGTTQDNTYIHDQKEKEAEENDWETPFIDANGNLTKIANPVLIERLRPYLDTEYRELAAAYNEIELFYGNRFEHMGMSAWSKLLNDIDWSSPTSTINPDITQVHQEQQRKKKSILKVVFPDGRVIQHSVAADTFVQVINEHYPELIAEIGIVHAGVPLVSKELDPKYSDYQKPISDGWYVFTNIRTDKKQADLKKISDELGLNLKISVIDPDDGTIVIPAEIVNESNESSNRTKIRVKFPDGKTIQPNKVLDALVEVVKFAGAERVRALNIIVCGDNMITKNPRPRYIKPCKPVGNGWLCNTCSDTPTKYEQIIEISEKLGLGIKAYLI